VLLSLILLAFVTGAGVCCALAVIAAARYRRVRPPGARNFPPISILKPLAGLDEGLEENLASFFEQRYPEFELLFAVTLADDPAIPVVEKLRSRYRAVPSRLIVTGASSWPNLKDYSLERMLAEARHELIVMADSDVRVGPDLLATLAAEFEDQELGFSTCPYRAVPGPSFWTTLEALAMNTEMLSGVLVSRMLEGMRFTLGPTVAARRSAIAQMGGFAAIKDYTSDDFMLGKLAAERGSKIILSSYAVEHRLGAEAFLANAKHRLRWNRAMRRLRRWGYVGEIFMHPLPLAAILWMARPDWWPAAAAAALLRAAAGFAAAATVRDPLTRRLWWLIPLADAANFLAWLAGFFGSGIEWRGRKYRFRPDGTFEPRSD
jgi:ceramide glucosyltransferase